MQPVTLSPGQQCELLDRVSVPQRAPMSGGGASRGNPSEGSTSAPGATPLVHLAGLSDFHRIHTSGVEVAHWVRPDAAPDGLRLPAGPAAWKGSAEEALEAPDQVLALLPEPGDRVRLREDLVALTGAFLAIAAGARVQATLAVVPATQCPKWHIDHVVVRLTCAWRGRGTQWACGDGVDLSMLGRPVACVETANRAIVADTVTVREAASGDVVLLRGRAHPGGVSRTVHRSPAVSEADGARLVWTLTAWG